MTAGHAQQFCAPVVAPTGTTATGTKLLPEAKATVGEPHLLVDRRLDWHRAHHEAGHITVAWLLAMNASGATINGQGATFFGEERISDPGKTLDLAAALARLMPPLGASRDDVAVDLLRCVDITICSMAGIEAERLCCGSAHHNTHDESEARAIAALVVRSRSPAVIDAFIRFATIEAAALVDANVGIVLSLARELLVHRSLNADQIAEIVEKAKLALIEARVPGTSPFDPIQTVQ